MLQTHLSRYMDKYQNYIFRLPFYHLTLEREKSKSLTITPFDPWPGDAKIGMKMVDNVYEFAGQSIYMDQMNWRPFEASLDWLLYAHRFDWLRDLKDVAHERARRKARDLIAHWFRIHKKWDAFAWSPLNTAKRLMNLISLHHFYAASADESFLEFLNHHIYRQIQHLMRIQLQPYKGNDLIFILTSLIACSMNLSLKHYKIKVYEHQLIKNLPNILLEDGCHRSKNPTTHLELVRVLLDLRRFYTESKLDFPQELKRFYKMTASVAKFFTTPQNSVFLFQGARSPSSPYIQLLSSQLGSSIKTLSYLEAAGFYKVTLPHSILMVELGEPPAKDYDKSAHAGTFSFELFLGKEKIITNCGHPNSALSDFDRLLATSAAHSTVIVENTNSSEVLRNSLGQRPRYIYHDIQRHEQETVLEMSHDGYDHNYGIIHKRVLRIDHKSEAIKGMDQIIGPGGKQFAIRFHLHPKVRASLIQNGEAVLLQSVSGHGLQISASHHQFQLEPSLYMGDGMKIEKSLQLVIYETTKNMSSKMTTIHWEIRAFR